MRDKQEQTSYHEGPRRHMCSQNTREFHTRVRVWLR